MTFTFTFSVCLTLYSTILSRFFHVVANGTISFFLWLSNILWYLHTTSSLSVHLLMDRLLHILAIVNSAAANIWVWVSFQITVFVFSALCPEVGLLDHTVVLFLVF